MGSSPIAELFSVYSSTTLLQKVGLVTTQKLEKIDPKYGLSGALMEVYDGTVPQPDQISRHRRIPPPTTFAVIHATVVGFVLWASG
jgi:hypothetical protein